ncbi:MAG: ATP-dependent Clp protease adaptor ClpS [Planctomycetes bacterium]|nr:ATP-dependent Clp protease adaptor ClpS [Planctomycetota bacterium]
MIRDCQWRALFGGRATAVSPAEAKLRPARLWNVVLLDDDDHTYEYVVEMLTTLFQHPASVAYQMAVEVDSTGRVIVETTSLERAELKRDQIHAYGADPRLRERSRGSMSAVLEPVE